MTLTNIGNLMYLRMSQITTLEQSLNIPHFCIQAAAEYLKSDRNWVPIIVKEVQEDKYQVIGNSFVYAVSEAAGVEKIWCIIADANAEELAKILAQEKAPKINLCTASADIIKAALEYLIEQPNSVLKGVKLLVAASRINSASDRPYWKNLAPIVKLKCGITAAKLEALEEVFYLVPKPLPETQQPETVKDSSSDLKSLTVTELRNLAKERGFTGCSKKSKPALIELLNQ